MIVSFHPAMEEAIDVGMAEVHALHAERPSTVWMR
jgi:hypothetical protein